MTEESLVADVGLEIIYGCDRFDKFDLKEIIKQEGFNIDSLKEKTEKWVRSHWPIGTDINMPASFIKQQLTYWYD